MSNDALTFDLVVLGGGPAGVTAAKSAALAGLRVALISAPSLMGYGLEGVYKSKALWELAREYHVMQSRWGSFAARPDMAGLADSAQRGTDHLRAAHRHELGRLGITLVEARGHFLDAHTLRAGERTLRGEAILVTTGTRPRRPNHIAVDGELILTADEIVGLKHIPESLLVLGAGVIGCEFASIFAAFGTQVTLLDSRARILGHEDADVSALLARSFARLGVDIRPEARCVAMEVVDGRVRTTLASGEVLQTSHALVAIGRTPNTDGLGLEQAGLVTDAQGYLPVGPELRTTVPHIFAAGDVGLRATALDLCLVHVAEAEARQVVAALTGRPLAADMNHVPFLVFTLPLIAGAGDGEDAARARHGAVRVGKFANLRNHRAHAKGQRSGFVKLIVGPEGDDRVLGVRAVGDGVDTVVGEVSLMIQNHMPYTRLLDAIHAHPSLSESLEGAARIICRDAVGYQEGEDLAADFWID